jgi:hypothetical protein
MPPRWPRKPDRRDPDYRRLDDRMNFALHVAIFLTLNSGLWFFHNLYQADWPWLFSLSGVWLAVLAVHLFYIAVIANYSVKNNG